MSFLSKTSRDGHKTELASCDLRNFKASFNPAGSAHEKENLKTLRPIATQNVKPLSKFELIIPPVHAESHKNDAQTHLSIDI